MSTGEESSPTSEIIRQGIEQLKAHNAKANADLTAQLQDLRDKISAGYNTPTTTFPDPLPSSAPDAYTYNRIVLWASQWNSEVVAAAALNEEFRNETGEKAKQILRDAGMLPPEPEEPAEGDTAAG